MREDQLKLGVADLAANPAEPVAPKLRDSLLYGVKEDPDFQAKMKAYAKRAGLPLPVALGEKDTVTAEGRVADLDPNGMVRGTPRTADWLANPDNAAIAHDDVPQLQSIEQTVRNTMGLGKAAALNLGVGLTGLAGAVNDVIDPLGLVVGTGSENRAKVDASRRRMSGAADAAMPQTDNPWAGGVNAGIVSLFQNVPLVAGAVLLRNPSIALGVMAGSQGGEAYGEAKDAGKNTVQALGYGAAQGGVEYLTEKLPMGELIGDLTKGTGILKTLGKQLALDMPGEQLATVMQDFNEQITLHPEKSMGDYLRERPNAAISTAVASVVGTLGTTAVGEATNAVMGRAGREEAQVQRGAEQTAVIGEMMKAAQASALRERSPETFHDYVAAATRDTPVEKVYVQAQDLVDALADGSPEALAQNAQVLQAMPSVMAQMEDALPGNGLVEIPVAELLAYTPDSGLAQTLMENLKVDPQGFSMKQGETFMQEQGAKLKADMVKAVQQGVATDEFTASSERVTQAVKTQLDTVNRFTPDVNSTYAQLLGAFYTTQAARWGVSPEEMAASHPVTFQAQGVGGDQSLSENAARPTLDEEFYDKLVPEGALRNAIGVAVQPSVVSPEQGRAAIAASLAEGRADVARIIVERAERSAKLDEGFAADGPQMGPEDPRYEKVLAYQKQAAADSRAWADEARTLAGEAADMPPTWREAVPAPKNSDLKQAPPKLTPAVKINGKVYAAEGTHFDALSKAFWAGEDRQRVGLDGSNRGFVNHKGQFVTRARAMKYAVENDLLAERYKAYSNSPELIAEWLKTDDLNQDAAPSQAHYKYDPGLGFQSSLFATVMEKGQARASAEQWLAQLQNTPGVKKEEIEWIGLPEALKVMGAEGAITKEQVLTYIAQNGVRLEEVVLGGEPTEDAIQARADELENEAIEQSHFDPPYYVIEDEIETEDDEGNTTVETRYMVFGTDEGFDSEEAAQEAADEANSDAEREWLNDQGFYNIAESELRENNGSQYSEYQAIKGGENYREVLLTMPRKVPMFADGGPPVDANVRLTRDFTANMGHWAHDNVLAHTRLADFKSPDGKRVLGVLEIQSDWHQKGRDKGYAVEASAEEREAAADAMTDAQYAANSAGDALLDALEPVLRARIPELEAQRDEGRKLVEALNPKYIELGDQLKPLRDEADRTGVDGVEFQRLRKAINDIAAERERINRAADSAAGYVNEAKRFYTSMFFAPLEGQAHGGAINRSMSGYRDALRIVANDKLWQDTAMQSELEELDDLRDAYNTAQLKFNEAEQRQQQATGASGIPDAPFKSTWPALVMKRIVQMAVEQGYDRVVWATGEQQADLYDMRSQVGEVDVRPADMSPDGLIHLRLNYDVANVIAQNGHGEGLLDYAGGKQTVAMSRENVLAVFGSEMGGQFLSAADKSREAEYNGYVNFDADNLTVGGEGHKYFYNKMLPKIATEIIKKFDAKVEPQQIVSSEGSTYSMRQLKDKIAALEPIVAALPPQEDLEAGRAALTDAVRANQERMTEVTQAMTRLAVDFSEGSEYAKLYAERQALAVLPEGLRQQQAKLEARNRLASWKEELAKYTPTQLGFNITDKMRAEQAAVEPKLFQGDDTVRGAFTPSTNTITLLRNADLSTTLHELGHFFVETVARMAVDPNAPQQVRDDWNTTAAFMGFAGIAPDAWLAIPVDARREGHERYARGFEAYLREGKAPSAALRGPFQRFKAWLIHVYKSVSQLNVELTDEVRSVFDRLIASEDEIAKAEAMRGFAPVFATRPDGMTEMEWENYQRLGEDATATAQEELQGRSIRDMRWLRNTRARIIRELAKEARDKRKAVAAEVSAEIYAEPVYAAQQYLRRGILNGETVEGAQKLRTEDVAAIYEGVPATTADWRKLGFGRYGMLSDEGMDPDMAAELFGFSSGHEMIEALMVAPPAREEIEGRTDQRMLERYGDLKDPDAIARAADEAIHNTVRLRFVATEANALAKAAGKKSILAEAARDFARELIGRQRIRDLRPAKYTGAETRAAGASATAAAKGDLVLAATEKRNQLINAYAAKAAYDAQDEVAKALRYLARFDSTATRKGMDADYRDQIDALLERFDLRTSQSLKAIDKRKSLAKWIEAQQAQGLDPLIDEDLANEAYRKHFRDMTVDELRGLIDAVKNIAHLGRLKNKLLVAAKGRAFKAVVDEAEALIREQAYRTIPEKIESNTVGDRILSGFANFGAIHRKFASLIREMGGTKNDGGILWSAFIQPMNKANDKEAVMREQATEALARVFKTLTVRKGELRRKIFIPEIGTSLSLEGRLAVALNWGNELNRARVMDGDKWDAVQVAAILRTLTPDQLGFVNNLWEYLDTYWPQIAAKERRITGVEPVKVEAQPFEVTASNGEQVAMRGGYYPIKYDTERSTGAEQHAIAENVTAALRGAYTRATTRRGHTKARVDKVERPVRKDLMVPFQHVNQVIHDLAFHEYLIDANRLITAPAIDSAIRDHYGVETLRTIKRTLNDMAEGDLSAEDSLERVVNYVRVGTTITGLGWNLMSGLMQPLGLTQSIARIGPKYMAKGIGRAFADAATLQNTVKEIGEKSDFMRLRAKTFMREVAEVQGQVRDTLKPGALAPIEASFFILIQKLQLVADVPTWLGAYAKAQDQGHDDDTAVGLADQAVRDSQGSGQIGDLAQIQRGSAWLKLWTNFYSFFNVTYNQIAEAVGETRRAGPGRLPLLAGEFLLLAVVPAVMAEMLKQAIRGDDWDWEELGPALFKAEVSYLLGMMVGLREFGMAADLGLAAAGKPTLTSNNGKGPAALRLLTSDLPQLIQQVSQGEADTALRKAALNTAGILLHFPAGQINRTLDGFEALAQGETRNPLALLVGPPRD